MRAAAREQVQHSIAAEKLANAERAAAARAWEEQAAAKRAADAAKRHDRALELQRVFEAGRAGAESYHLFPSRDDASLIAAERVYRQAPLRGENPSAMRSRFLATVPTREDLATLAEEIGARQRLAAHFKESDRGRATGYLRQADDLFGRLDGMVEHAVDSMFGPASGEIAPKAVQALRASLDSLPLQSGARFTRADLSAMLDRALERRRPAAR